MSFFGFSKVNDIPLSERIMKRWQPSSNGLILDSKRNNNFVWKVNFVFFENFLLGVERRSGQSLGRRLAHASSESEEWFFIDTKIKSPHGKNPQKWKKIIYDWQERGLGAFELIDNDEELRFNITNPINGPLCAGVFSSTWEYSTNTRHRFRWNQNAPDSLVLSMAKDAIDIPTPHPSSFPWYQNREIQPLIYDEDFWDTLIIEENKTWSIMGARMGMIHQDLIIRFENYFLPHIDGIHEGRVDSFSWVGLDKKNSTCWTIFSDTIREIFFSEGHHILISEEQDWLSIARRHLAQHGLGSIDSVSTIDDFGGIEIFFSDCFHPAFFTGILSGCWERAYGRSVKSEFRVESDTNVLKLTSLSTIAR